MCNSPGTQLCLTILVCMHACIFVVGGGGGDVGVQGWREVDGRREGEGVYSQELRETQMPHR